MRRLGLPPKLRLAPLWPALAALAVGGAFLWFLLPGMFEHAASVQLFDTLRILTPIVQKRVSEPPAPLTDPGDLKPWVRQLAADSGLRITLIRSDGVVIARQHRGAGARGGDGEPSAASRGPGRPHPRLGHVGAHQRHHRRHLRLRRPDPWPARGANRSSCAWRSLWRQLQVLQGRLAVALTLAALVAALAILVTPCGSTAASSSPSRASSATRATSPPAAPPASQVPDEDELAALALALNRLAATAEEQFEAVRKGARPAPADPRQHVRRRPGGRAGRSRPDDQPRLHTVSSTSAATSRAGPVLEIIRHPGFARLIEETLRQGRAAERPDRARRPRAPHPAAGSSPITFGGAGSGDSHGAVVATRDTTELTRVADHAQGLRRQRLP